MALTKKPLPNLPNGRAAFWLLRPGRKELIMMGLDVISVAMIMFVICVAVYQLFNTQRVKHLGIPVRACVCDIKESSVGSGEDEMIKEEYYVVYFTREGQRIETELINSGEGLYIGEWITIKYLPERPDYPVWVREYSELV